MTPSWGHMSNHGAHPGRYTRGPQPLDARNGNGFGAAVGAGDPRRWAAQEQSSYISTAQVLGSLKVHTMQPGALPALVPALPGREIVRMTKVTEKPKRRTGLLIWLIVSQLLAVGSLWIWALVAGLSVMAFDEGSSPIAWAIVLTVWAYPLFPLLMAIGAWIAFAFRKNRLAAVLTGLTFLPLVLLCLLARFANLIGL
jgi:hypothetical protein